MNLLGVSVGAALVAGVVAVGWQFVRSGQTTLGHSADTPNMNQMAAGSFIVEVKVPLTFSSNATMGKRAFEAKCASCHGVNAAGQNGVAPPLVHKIYEPSHHTDIAFVLAVQNGVRAHHWPFGSMPPVEGLTSADVKHIALYVRELQRENGIK